MQGGTWGKKSCELASCTVLDVDSILWRLPVQSRIMTKRIRLRAGAAESGDRDTVLNPGWDPAEHS